MSNDVADALEALADMVLAGPSIIKELKKQFPDKTVEIDQLAKLDPSGAKYSYIQWMWKQVRAGEDPDEVGRLIEDFHHLSRTKPLKLPPNVDMLRLLRVTHEEELEEIYKKIDHTDRKKNPPKVLFDRDGYKATELFSKEQVLEAGKGTTWCVSKQGTNFYEEYDKPGSRFIVIKMPDGKRRMALLGDNDYLEQLRDEEQTGDRDVSDGDRSRWVLEELGIAAEFSEEEAEFNDWYEKIGNDAIFKMYSRYDLQTLLAAADQYKNIQRYLKHATSGSPAQIELGVYGRGFDTDAAWEQYKKQAQEPIKKLGNEALATQKLLADKDPATMTADESLDFKVSKSTLETLRDDIVAHKYRDIPSQIYWIDRYIRHPKGGIPRAFWYELLDIACGAIMDNLSAPKQQAGASAELLEAMAETVEALHYSDFLGKSFEDFRQKYVKVAKSGEGYGLFVQFTSHAKDALERNPYMGPVTHSDPAGVYGYPLEYVLKHPADIWYGHGAKFLRVLRNRAGASKTLDLQGITANRAIDYLTRIGATDKDGNEITRASQAEAWMKKVAKQLRDRITGGGNKAAKVFFLCMQQHGPDHLEPISAAEQTKRFLRLGFKALVDNARNENQAIVNGREPNQIIFLDRSVFEVVETFHMGGKDNHIHNTFNTEALDRPTAAKIATIMDDKLTGDKERSSLMGWTYWWTKKGRRIELRFEKSRRAMDQAWKGKFGSKKHKASKLWTPHEAHLVVHSELGDVSVSVSENERLQELIDGFTAQWEHLSADPQPTDWKPQTGKEWRDADYEKRVSQYRKQAENKLIREGEEFKETTMPLLASCGIEVPQDIGEDLKTLGAISKALSDIHYAVQENPIEQADSIYNVFMKEAEEDGLAHAPVVKSIWPGLRATYTAYPEALKTDMLYDDESNALGRAKFLDNWLKFVAHKRSAKTAAAQTVLARNFDTLEEFFEQFGEPAGSLLMDQVASRIGTNRLTAVKGGSQGTQGLVFDIPGAGRVLKLSVPPTSSMLKTYKADPNAEVRTCAVLMARPTDLCVHIHDVFGLKAAKSGFQGFGIVMEKLTKLDPRYLVPINVFAQFLITKPLTVESVKAADQYASTMIEDEEREDYEKVKQFLLGVAQYFAGVGVRYLDLHAGNVMQRGDALVMIDFGLSKSPETKVETLEASKGKGAA